MSSTGISGVATLAAARAGASACVRFTRERRATAAFATTAASPRASRKRAASLATQIISLALGAALAAGSAAALAQGPLPTVPLPPKIAGKVEHVTVHGESLAGNLSGDSPDRAVAVYLPPSYAAGGGRRYPVVYLLHGFTDTETNWFGLTGRPHFVNVPGAVERAIAAGAREAIVVMPNAFTRFQGSMYSSSAATGDWEAFVAKDLVAFVDSRYRTLPNRASRGLAGHSMGGYGTMRIGMKYPDVFSSLYSLSPCCMAADVSPAPERFARALAARTDADLAAADFGTKAVLASAAAWSANPKKPPFYVDLPIADGKAAPDVVARWAANAPLSMVHQYLPQLRRYDAIAVDAGDDDTGIAGTVRTLDGILTDYGIPHVADIYPGDHVNRVDQRLETKVMPFFSAHLAFD